MNFFIIKQIRGEAMDNINYDESAVLANEFYIKYRNAVKDFEKYRKTVLPLCAAENIVSEFSKKPLLYGLQERYILGGLLDYNEDNNMVGSKILLPFYEIISEQCNKLFGAYYTDCRSLSGMNALQNVLLSLVKQNDNILILSTESGGHAALPNILERLGINYNEAPFDYNACDYDYNSINSILEEQDISFVLFAPTDIIFLPDFNKFCLPKDVVLIFDASQVLAYYINNVKNNPLYINNKVILMGGTHKTIPGVTKALIMTNDEELAYKIDKTINPLYLRNTHMQNVASLILTLVEMEYFSEKYCANMTKNSNYLGGQLQKLGLQVMNYHGVYSQTHQLFIHMPRIKRDSFFCRANQFGISMNKKEKKLFNGSGIRIGLQEVTRYGWGTEEMDIVAKILILLYKNNIEELPVLLQKLSVRKEIQYTFKERGQFNEGK